jgi:hypothetical protein
MLSDFDTLGIIGFRDVVGCQPWDAYVVILISVERCEHRSYPLLSEPDDRALVAAELADE